MIRNRSIWGFPTASEKFGGKFLVKGALGEVLEGTFPSHFIVMHEFPSISRFKEWYYSEEYRPWKALRQEAADANVILSR